MSVHRKSTNFNDTSLRTKTLATIPLLPAIGFGYILKFCTKTMLLVFCMPMLPALIPLYFVLKSIKDNRKKQEITDGTSTKVE